MMAWVLFTHSYIWKAEAAILGARNGQPSRPEPAQPHKPGAVTHRMLREAAADHERVWCSFVVSYLLHLQQKLSP